MIVRRHDGELILIRQLDHSALSGEFARHWGNERFERPAPLEPVALASARHDEGWRGPDDEPYFDPAQRGPLHFRDITVPEHVVLYAKGVDRITALDPYAGLLVSMHGAGFYARRYGTFPVKMSKLTEEVREVADAFVAEQEALQAALKRHIWDPMQRRSEFERRLWTHYELLQVWDRLSLFVCLNDPSRPAEDRLGPMPVTADGPVTELRVRTTGDGVMMLDPYPFGVAALEARVTARAISDRRYETAGDLRTALLDVRDVSIRCRFVAG
ncbi:MAG: DUF3891 family protein [Armatimonadota bacterium]